MGEGTARVAAFAFAAVIVQATPVMAGSPYQGDTQAARNGGVAPASAPHGAGLYSCSFRELRTKLERKNCHPGRY